MDQATLTVGALIVYTVSLGASLAWVRRADGVGGDGLATVGPQVFLLASALFTLPLPVRTLFTFAAEGDISPQLRVFAPYIPTALLYCAAFNLVFGARFLALSRSRAAPTPRTARGDVGWPEWLALIAVSAVALWMLRQLASEAGGLVGLVLLGYGVTETLVGAGHYAVGFEWLAGVTVVAFAIALQARRRWLVLAISAGVLVETAAYVIMGRRGALVVLLGSCLYLVHALRRRFTARTWLALGAAGFLALNAVGLLRGAKYDDLASVVEAAATRGEAVRDVSEKSDLLYTITTGHFAVPFETLPQVMRTFGDVYLPGLGAYTLRSLSFFVPAGLWEDRPLPLANWYMKAFYGETVLNEGRQFFFLSEAYMNFGALGAALWGLVLAWGWFVISRLSRSRAGDPLAASLVALVIGSSLSAVAADTGFLVAFVKGYALPVIVVAGVRRVRAARRGEAAP